MKPEARRAVSVAIADFPTERLALWLLVLLTGVVNGVIQGAGITLGPLGPGNISGFFTGMALFLAYGLGKRAAWRGDV